MYLNGTADGLLGKKVFFPLSVLAALFVEIHNHLMDNLPHKLLKTGSRGYCREIKWLVLMLASLAQNSLMLSSILLIRGAHIVPNT
jgi:hypothetical protein